MSATTAATLATSPVRTSSAARVGVLLYGVVCYVLGVSGLCWMIAVTLGIVPFTGGPIAVGSTGAAIALNLALIASFGVQHAIMARPEFKARWTKIVSPAIERSTFVVLAGLLMANTMWLFQPLPTEIWTVGDETAALALRIVCAAGWAYMLASTFAINHFQLFGLRQVFNYFRGRDEPNVPFVSRLMYRFDRHPIMTGVLIALWANPVMRLDSLVLALGFTTYIVVGVAIEERDLVRAHGDDYRSYRRRVRSVVPRLAGRD